MKFVVNVTFNIKKLDTITNLMVYLNGGKNEQSFQRL
jgi:hypothetical protein